MSEDHEVPTSCYCSTTSMPPCGYCEGKGDCGVCGSHFNCEELNEMNDGMMICDDCYEARRNEAEERLTQANVTH
jgi:hypothetical protein